MFPSSAGLRFPGRRGRTRSSRNSERKHLGAVSPLVVSLMDGKVDAMDVLRILLAILLPPLGVFLQVGIGLHFWINILLTLLGYIPGVIHAIYIIIKK
ncbi:MAG TPA: YqaE/Pmp3 family membrane protein [Arenibaculum sp.]|nr:YqaE/Pmp3 family membrane protein [Arenibaculum sp.]